MLTITVEFLFGTYRADPDGTAHTSRLEKGEWPPAPSRLFDALVAADGTGNRCLHTTGLGIMALESAPPPRIDASSLSDVCHQQLEPRFVPKSNRGASRDNKGFLHVHQEYIGRKGAQVRPGVRVSPRASSVRYVWNVDVDDVQFHDLRMRAARVGYLGCADSPVRVHINRTDTTSVWASSSFVPDPLGELAIGVPSRGRLQILDTVFESWQKDGPSTRRSQFPALVTKARYRPLPFGPSLRVSGEIVASLILQPSLSGRRASALIAKFKAAVLRKFQEIHSAEPPQVLHGHGFSTDGYELARYLALPDVNHRHARGNIHGIALWLPTDCDPELAAAARDAVHSIRRLSGSRVNVGVEVWDRQRRPAAANPNRWSRASRRWATVFPAVHERHTELTLGEICRWCEHSRLPNPIAFRSSRAPFVTGGSRLLPSEVHRPGRPGRPFSHIELMFEELVAGPIVIGSARSRGMGLCVPLGETSSLPKRIRRES